MDKRFLSIVVPCYNSKRLEKLLQSVVDCEMSKDIEVILVDDCSTESYQEDVDKFLGDLNIRQEYLDHNCGSPSNGRELGAQCASGTYITFIDHDDYLIPEGIWQLRKYVKDHDYPEYLVAGIRQVDADGNTETEKYGILPFLHGKFFHREKFYKKCNLHHKIDIKYQEDNWFTALVACNLIKHKLEPTFLDFCTYSWFDNPDSLSKSLTSKKQEDKELNLEILRTNISIAEDILIKFAEDGSLPKPVMYEWLIREVLKLYFDTQLYPQFKEDYKDIIPDTINHIKEVLAVTNRDIMDIAFSDNGRMFMDELNNIYQFYGDTWVPHQRAEEFLNEFTPDDSLKEILELTKPEQLEEE